MTTVRYRFADYVLDLDRHELRRNGVAVPLQARVFECLGVLIEQRDRAVDRDTLLQAIFGRTDVSDAQLAQVVLRTRRAVGDDGQSQHSIRTVPRFGFRWVAPVVVETGPDVELHVAGLHHLPAPAAGQPAGLATVPDAPDVAPDDAPDVAPDVAPASAPAVASAGAVPTSNRAWRGGAWLRRRTVVMATVVLSLLLLALGLGWRSWAPQDAASKDAASSALQEPAEAARVATGGPAATSRAVMVLPTAAPASGEQSWVRLGLMDFVADRLRRSGVPALSSETVMALLRDQPAQALADAPDTATLQRLRGDAQAAWIVTSTVAGGSDARPWDVVLQATDRNGVRQVGRAGHVDLLEAARLATDRLAAALGGHDPAPEGSAPGLPERLQRARAAMLANEIEVARKILLEAPELQRAQPRLRYQLARVDFRAGEYARAMDTLDALLAGAESRDDAQFRTLVLNARGAVLIRLDRLDEARQAFDAAIALAADGSHPTELGVALSGRAIVNATQERYEPALSDLGQARVQLGEAGDALAVARVDANLGILEVQRGRPAHALPYLDQAARDFSAMGAVNELAVARNAQVQVWLKLLRTDRALAASGPAQALLPRVRDPMQRADLVLLHAATLTQAGRLQEASELLKLPMAADAPPSEFGRRDYLQVEVVVQSGAAGDAVRLADAVLARWPAARNPEQRAWLRLRREQAALASGAETAPGPIPTLGNLLPDRLALATLQRIRRDTAAADATYRAALAEAERNSVPEEIAAVVVPYATWLIERGKLDAAAALAGRVAPWARHDYDVAVLQVRLLQALGQAQPWRTAVAHAQALAGERTLPAPLLVQPGKPPGASAMPGSAPAD